jgi:hypothetical protein
MSESASTTSSGHAYHSNASSDPQSQPSSAASSDSDSESTDSIALYDGIPRVCKPGRRHQLPFALSTQRVIIGRFLLNLGLLMAPLYTLWAGTAGQHLDFKTPSVAYRIVSITYPVIYLLLAFVVIEQVCRQHIFCMLS